MELLPEELRARLPDYQGALADPVACARFFIPGTNLNWFVTEGEPIEGDYRFFGFIRPKDEWGYFRLSHLTSMRGPLGQPVERDLNFKEGPFHDVVPAPDL